MELLDSPARRKFLPAKSTLTCGRTPYVKVKQGTTLYPASSSAISVAVLTHTPPECTGAHATEHQQR
jgi:hypothetical protein